MAVADELLKPISEEAPCGTDLSYDVRLQELDTLVRGKPETQFSAAEPPDWKLIRNRRTTQPPAHFHRNPLGRGQLAVFLRCSLLTYRFRYARR